MFCRPPGKLGVAAALSQKSGSSAQLATTRNQLMRAYISQWGWDEAKIALLDNRSNWRITQVMAETRSIHRELSSSYTQLSRETAEHTTAWRSSSIRSCWSVRERKDSPFSNINR